LLQPISSDGGGGQRIRAIALVPGQDLVCCTLGQGLYSTHLNLRPARETMVTRAQRMTHLLDEGMENNLRREIYPYGLLSPLDDAMRTPGAIQRRVPLSERIDDANAPDTGPYGPGLQEARAIRKLCKTHPTDMEEANRALPRVLADLEVERTAA